MYSHILRAMAPNDARCAFHLVQQYINPIRKWLVTPMMFMPFIVLVGLSCQISHYVAHKVYDRARLMIPSPVQHLPTLGKFTSREDTWVSEPA